MGFGMKKSFRVVEAGSRLILAAKECWPIHPGMKSPTMKAIRLQIAFLSTTAIGLSASNLPEFSTER